MRDPRPALEEFSTYAHEYCINLNDMIDRKERAFCSASADVYQGNLRTTGSQVAVKTGRGRLPGDEKTIKVVPWVVCSSRSFLSDNRSESRSRSTCLVQTRSQKCSPAHWNHD